MRLAPYALILVGSFLLAPVVYAAALVAGGSSMVILSPGGLILAVLLAAGLGLVLVGWRGLRPR